MPRHTLLLVKVTLFLVFLLHFSFLAMGWLRLVGSIKLQGSFAKEPYKRDDILQKRPVI